MTNNAYVRILMEQDGKYQPGDSEMEELSRPSPEEFYHQSDVDDVEPAEKPTVDNIFEFYEEVGMSADMGFEEILEHLNKLIGSIAQMIDSEVPESSRSTARIAVKKMWMDRIKHDFVGRLKEWR